MIINPEARPTLADVGSLLLDRTTLRGGSLAGAFTPLTTPTDAQVEALIAAAEVEIAPGLGPIPEEFEAVARQIVAYHTAIKIEAAYFSDEVEQNPARIELYERLRDLAITGLTSALQDNQPGGVRVYGVPITTVVAESSPFSSGLLP